MKALVKVHITYLFSEKVFTFTIGLFAAALILLLLSVEMGSQDDSITHNQVQLTQVMFSEMIHIGKLLIILYIFFLMVTGYLLHHYDVLLLNMTTIFHIKATKIVAVIILGGLFVTGYCLLFLLIALLFAPFFTASISYAYIYFDLLFFMIYYSILMMLLYEMMRHLVGLISGIGLYLITFINSTDYMVKDKASSVYKALSVIGLDYNYYAKEAFSFFYSKGYYSMLLLSLLLFVIYLRNNTDTLN